MREVDRAMIEDYGISLIQMMENAGRNLANWPGGDFCTVILAGVVLWSWPALVGTVGEGLYAPAVYETWGAEVRVWMTAPITGLSDVPLHQLGILQRMGISIVVAGELLVLPPADLLVDAMIGYSLAGSPTGLVATLIDAANNHGAPILALDVPSGVNTTTGAASGAAIRARATLTLALPKIGLCAETAKQHMGELYLADISVPPGLYSRPPLDLKVDNVFAQDEIVRLW